MREATLDAKRFGFTDIATGPGTGRGLSGSSPVRGGAPRATKARIVARLLGREIELRMTLRHFEKNRLVEYESAQSGMPDARHERHFVPANGGFLHGLVVEYEPRTGLRGLYDRLLLRRGVERALRQAVVSIADELRVKLNRIKPR